MYYGLYDSLWIFFMYSFLGWCMEVIHFAVTRGKFVNRGFLTGPACPVYGFGVLFVLQLLSPWYDNLPLLFIGSIVITTIVEYLIGWLTETLIHERLWDYSEYPFNFKGYICLRSSLLWGVLCLVVVNILHPVLMTPINMLPTHVGWILLAVIGAVFLTDLIITGIDALKIPKQIKAVEEVEQLLLTVSDGIGGTLADKVFEAKEKNMELREKYPELGEKFDSYIEAAKKVPNKAELEEKLEQYRALLTRGSHTRKRWASAYPRFNKAYLNSRVEELKEYCEKMKSELTK